MNPSFLLSTLGRLSVQAAIVVLVILLVQAVFRRWLTPRWRCALWLLLVARLLLPVSPPSPVSIFNLSAFRLWHADPALAPEAGQTNPGVADGISADQAGFRVATGEKSFGGATALAAAPRKRQSFGSAQERPFDFAQGRPIHLGAAFLGWAWLAGFAVFLLQVAFRSARWKARFAGSPRVFDPAVVELVEECAASLGITTRLAVFESGAVPSPVLYGLFRPRVVLPTGFVQRFSPKEVRFVILHEMVHLKNGDLILNWLTTGLQAIHWFNPLVWIGFERWRADRELACDAVVLKTVGAARKRDYGETIIQLMEGRARRVAVPGHVGVSAAPGELRSRVMMIMQFEPASRWSGLALLLVAGVGIACLTNSPSRPRLVLPLFSPAAVPVVPGSAILNRPTASPLAAAGLPRPLEARAGAKSANPDSWSIPTPLLSRPAAVSAERLPISATVAPGRSLPDAGAMPVGPIASSARPTIEIIPPAQVAIDPPPADGAPGAAYAGQGDLRVDVVVDVTDAGRKIIRPSLNHPAYYLPLTVGYKEVGAFVPGQSMPPPTLEVQHLLAKALYGQGYQVMNGRQPPSLVLVFWWGHIAPELNGTTPGSSDWHPEAFNRSGVLSSPWETFAGIPTDQSANEKMMISLVAGNTRDYQYATDNPNPKLEQVLAMERSPRYFAMVSAFDFKDWARHHTTLLWQAHISTELAGHSLGEVLPALIATAAPLFGRETTAPQLVAVEAAPSPAGRVILGLPVVTGHPQTGRPPTNMTPHPDYFVGFFNKGPGR